MRYFCPFLGTALSKYVRTLLVCIAFFIPGDAIAQCASAASPSCAVYSSCFERYCPCSGPSNYFTNYGLKYCRRFLMEDGWSDAGRRWRDRTLVCLQEAIVPHLPIGAPATCNCDEMRDLAYNSHVQCYTQPGASVCDLPASDVRRIWEIVDSGDLFDAYGLRQMAAVVAICLGIASSSRPDWDRVHDRIQERLRAGNPPSRDIVETLARLGFPNILSPPR